MKITNLSKTYRPKKSLPVQALKNVNLSLADCGMVFFLGKSGSGKSTLLNVLSGLDNADDGSSIEVSGKDLCKLTKSELDDYRNTCCGFVFQEYNLISELNVEENIALAIQLQGQTETENNVKEVLTKVELDGYEKRKVTELSGGQKQRIAIARALIKNPDIIFADEPTGALDKSNGDNVMSLLKELSKDKLVIVVSHDKEYAATYGDRIIELEDGVIINDSASDTPCYSENASPKQWKKSKLPLKPALKIGCSNFKRHPIRLIITLIMSVITFSLFGLSINIAMMNPYKSFINAVYEKNLEYTAIYKYQEVENSNTGTFDQIIGGDKFVYNELCLSKSDINLLQNKYDLQLNLICCAYIDSFQNSIAATIKQLNKIIPISSDHFSLLADGFMYMSLSECRNMNFGITGRLPENEKEIAINECMLNTFSVAGIKENGQTYPINSAGDIIGHSISVLVNTFTNGKPMPNNGKFGDSDIKTIVGVVDTGCDKKCSESHPQSSSIMYAENYHEKIFISENCFDEWSYILCNITPNKSSFKSFANFVFDYNNNNNVFRFSNSIMTDGNMEINAFYRSIDYINMDKNLYTYIGIILLIVSFVFMINFVATSIFGQTKQIGIITSLGANFKQQCKIYLYSSFIIAAIVYLLSVVFTAVGSVLYNNYIVDFSKVSFDLLKFNPALIIILFAIDFSAIILGCIIPLKRLRKLSSVEIINKGTIK